jgi:hypothetical protein
MVCSDDSAVTHNPQKDDQHRPDDDAGHKAGGAEAPTKNFSVNRAVAV